MCPHTTIYAYFSRYLGPLLPPPQVPSYSAYCYVSSHYYICVLSYYICVLILLQMHTAPADMARPSYSAYCYMCVLVLLDMCPHTAIYAYCSRRYGKTLLLCILLYVSSNTICVSSYYYICILLPLYMHTAPLGMARPSASTGHNHANRRAADQGAQARGDAAGITPYVSICSIRQHMSAYVSIRQHTSRRSGSLSAR
jgi:hypothetical protein